jgi:hypothetical protein
MLIFSRLSSSDIKTLISGVIIFSVVFSLIYFFRRKTWIRGISKFAFFCSLWFFLVYLFAILPGFKIGSKAVYNSGLQEYVTIDSMFYPHRIIDNYPIAFFMVCIAITWLLGDSFMKLMKIDQKEMKEKSK